MKQMIKKTMGLFTIMCVCLSLNAYTIYAYSHSFENCPNSGPHVGSNFNYMKAYENHKYYPGKDYNCWTDTSGGRFFIFYESWTCSYCGKHIAKETVIDVSTPAAGTETETEEK